jgi:hypothetical protein
MEWNSVDAWGFPMWGAGVFLFLVVFMLGAFVGIPFLCWLLDKSFHGEV